MNRGDECPRLLFIQISLFQLLTKLFSTFSSILFFHFSLYESLYKGIYGVKSKVRVGVKYNFMKIFLVKGAKYTVATLLFLVLGAPVSILLSILASFVFFIGSFISMNNAFITNTLDKLTHVENLYFIKSLAKETKKKAFIDLKE